MRTPSGRATSAVLLTVSGVIDPDVEQRVAAGERPRADYCELARGLGADLVDYAAASRLGGTIGRLIGALAGRNAQLAYACWRGRGARDVIFTDGEQVGIPLAAMLRFLGRGPRRTRHVMIVHTLSVPKKQVFFDWFGLQSHVDRFLVYSTWQKQFIESRWKVPAHTVVFTPFMVDQQFFSAGQVSSVTAASGVPTICAVGLERRDYPTLMDAVRGLPVRVVVAAASPWSKQPDETVNRAIPANVEVRRFTQYELRALYAESAFLVMPLQDVTFQAGVTAILEAMAMERAVICSRTSGQTDVIVEGENGVYVPPGDGPALRAAIVRLLEQPAEAARLGRNGRRLVEDRMNLDCYVQRLAEVVHSAGGGPCAATAGMPSREP